MRCLFDKIIRIVFVLFLVVVLSYESTAQSEKTVSKRALKFFEKAKQDFVNHNYEEALILLDKALMEDGEYLEALLFKAELGLELKNDQMSVNAYEQIFKIDSMFYPRSSISLSKLYENSMQYEKALELLDWYLSLDDEKEYYRNLAYEELGRVQFKMFLQSNPVSYDPKNIGNMVNSHNDEYVNQICANGNKLIFTRHYLENEKNHSVLKDDVLVSVKYDTLWTLPHFLFDNVSEIGAANISSDAKEIFFSACGKNDSHGSCDIYCMCLENGKWSNPINIHSINTYDWESQPCVSSDGKELYFVRANKKMSNSDVYVSTRLETGGWSKPRKLGPNINTEGNEMAPFVHNDGRTLYFSSDKRPGMGGYDLFVSHRDVNGEWMPAENLGYPLNTAEGDEINIVVSCDAQKAYISADRPDGFGGYDIYEFDLDDRFKPQAVEIIPLSEVGQYADAMDKNETIMLKNIYFEFDSAELTADSEDGISILIDYMNSYPEMKIILLGHTDDAGTEAHNQSLSKRRAESVKDALVNGGISSDRITTKGYGSAYPLVPNENEEQRAINRRVEMKRF